MSHNDVSDAEAERGATIAKRLQGIHPGVHPRQFDVLGPYTDDDGGVEGPYQYWNVILRDAGGHQVLAESRNRYWAELIRDCLRSASSEMGNALARCVQILREVEWGGGHHSSCCPMCRSVPSEGHCSKCLLKTAIDIASAIPIERGQK